MYPKCLCNMNMNDFKKFCYVMLTDNSSNQIPYVGFHNVFHG